jgi:hypothetical protein
MRSSVAPPVRLALDAPPAGVSARVRMAIARTPSSSLGPRVRVLLAVAVSSVLTLALALLASHVAYHRYTRGLEVPASSAHRMLVVLLLLVALVGVATLVASWRGRRGFGAGTVSLLVTIGLVAPLYAALVLVIPAHAHDPEANKALLSEPVRCLSLSAAVGLLVLASFTMALRRSVVVASRLRGAALGAAAGAWAGLAVFIFCPSNDLHHLFLGHVLPVVAFTVLGVIGVPRVLRL